MRTVSSLLGPFQVWDADNLGNVLEAGQFWDSQLKPFIDSAAINHQDDWAIDIGANVGWFTRYLSTLFAHVVAVEAHPETFALLQQNVQGLDVHRIQGVAYDRDGVWFAPPPRTPDLHRSADASSVAFVRTYTDEGLAKSVVLDNLVAATAHVALIKCDAQGCDLRALRGCRAIIRRCRPVILLEYEPGPSSWHGDDWDDYRQFFRRLAYRVIRVRKDISDYVAYPEES